jgi:hypothetical protein
LDSIGEEWIKRGLESVRNCPRSLRLGCLGNLGMRTGIDGSTAMTLDVHVVVKVKMKWFFFD